MNNSRNAIDYYVTKKPSGLNILVRIALVILYIAVLIVPTVVLGKLIPGFGYIIGGVIFIIVDYIVFSLTWRHVSYDLRYQIYTPSTSINDETPYTCFRLDKMKRNNKKETVPHFIFMAEMRKAICIAPYTEANKEKYTGENVRTIDFRSSPDVTTDVYFLRFPESAAKADDTTRFENHMKGGASDIAANKTGDVVIIVEAVNKIVDAFKHFAKDVTEVTTLSR